MEQTQGMRKCVCVNANYGSKICRVVEWTASDLELAFYVNQKQIT